MAEYINVEKPFLDKLKALGWTVIDQGQGIPGNPKKSMRTDFLQVMLEEEFKTRIQNINTTATGQKWLTDSQLDDLIEELKGDGIEKLHEANKRIHEFLVTKMVVDENKITGEQNPSVKLIDYETIENNSFIAINQFRVNTPNTDKKCIIPDIVLFVNGMPLVVVEAKDEEVSQPISEAVDQIRRYSNTRGNEYNIKEGEERLFHFNLFSIATHGIEARVGSITAEADYYYNWKDIFPEIYKTIAVTRANDSTQEVMIRGILNHEILLDILRNFTVFLQLDSGNEIKIVPRYQQYRAVGKIMTRLRTGKTPDERSGVVWHTQGSGKSLTMAFAIKKIRSQDDLKDFKIILVVDRTDLEEQLTATAGLVGKVNVIDKRKSISKLSDDASTINMVMIHKFLQEQIKQSKALQKAFSQHGKVPKFKDFEIVNDSERILIMIDEAHRTQGGEMGDNLFLAFPKATKIAFTGTPLLTPRHKRKTHERFGNHSEFIDTYKIQEAVRDRATLPIRYIGKASKDKNKDAEAFQQQFEDMFRERTVAEKEEIKKRYGTMQAYLENKDRIKKIANDLVDHYVQNIMPDGFKAMVVSGSILAACRYRFSIQQAIQKKIKAEESKPLQEQDAEILKRLKFLKVEGVISSQDNNESAIITRVRKSAKERNAIDSFKKGFDYDNPDTGVAFLCVCDRLLTGFDAPIAQVMYLDKNLREHDLLQAIARVNRTRGEKKNYGLIVDYYGVSNNLKEALAIWDGEEEVLEELMESFGDINKEFPVLEARYQRLIYLFQDYKIKNIERFIKQTMASDAEEMALVEKVIELAGDVKFRAQFDTYLKAFFDVLDLLLNLPKARPYYIPSKRFGYLFMRIKNHYRDPTMDLKWAGEKVRKLIDEYLISEGISSRIPMIELFSDDFPKHIDKSKLTAKTKASEMEHAIRRHIKINGDKDPGQTEKFKKRLEEIMRKFQDNWELCIENLQDFIKEMKDKEDGNDSVDGLPSHVSSFYRLIQLIAFDGKEISEDLHIQVKNLTEEIMDELNKKLDITNFWKKASLVRELTGEIEDLFYMSKIEIIYEKHEQLAANVIKLAKDTENIIKRNRK